MHTSTTVLDGESLLPEQLYALSQGTVKLDFSKDAWERIKRSRQLIDDIVRKGDPVYGINTGFGFFATTPIEPSELHRLQINLITSHAAGVGEPISVERTRMLLALRLNVFAKGHSGIRPENVQRMLDAFNASCLSWVPCKGTVGASGDLAPLAHLALGLIGQGKMWDPTLQKYDQANEVLQRHGLTPIDLHAKEGLAMINGTQFMTAHGTEALVRATRAALQADVIAALTLETLHGTHRAFDEKIHRARPHTGQIECAARLRSLLHTEEQPSQIYGSHHGCGRIQDAYTLRCIPQVHGIAHDTLAFVRKLVTTEINSATDNPMVFAETQQSLSGGNFHGEYIAKACDFLAIGIHEISSMSERRIERLVNSSLSGLPAFLVKAGGLNSGFMIAHCTAAALVSENKVLCHPASVDSQSTSAAKEDHVSMGGFASRKAIEVVSNVETVIAIELLAACQALEFLRPLRTTAPLEAVHQLVRQHVKPFDEDRFMSPDIEAVVKLIRENKVWEAATAAGTQ
ncbi:histidine ammonia-lyase [Capsaspora owczarzaki ATCC 30864]|uniref:histidine ammonia-lyase n=1 Tax=Capsaspora owczarzaki (strain ATCC 30864) TaxID=595528 RepID=UPI0003520FDE|nr:histidine ammonia-lyase [Capsaspora owczarzaki ATCC 30864]|eukprot:XP_004348121.2 histidine ammonia-lyase [Capsaspora owczarzaki ATCC 30864]